MYSSSFCVADTAAAPLLAVMLTLLLRLAPSLLLNPKASGCKYSSPSCDHDINEFAVLNARLSVFMTTIAVV